MRERERERAKNEGERELLLRGTLMITQFPIPPPTSASGSHESLMRRMSGIRSPLRAFSTEKITI
jgi:hypothetical protein